MGQKPTTWGACGAAVAVTFIVVSACAMTGCIPVIHSDPYPEVWTALKEVRSGSCGSLDGEYVVFGKSGTDDRSCPTLTRSFFTDHFWGVVRTVRLRQDGHGRLMVEALDGDEVRVRQRIDDAFVSCTSDGVKLSDNVPESDRMYLAITRDNDLAIKYVSSSTRSGAGAPFALYERTSGWCLYPVTRRSEPTEGVGSHEASMTSPASEVASVLELDGVRVMSILETDTRFLAFNDKFGWRRTEIDLPPGAYRVWFKEKGSLWSADDPQTRVVNANLVAGHRYVLSTSDDGSRIYDMTSGETTVVEH